MTTAPYAATAEPTDPLSGPRLARVAQQYGTPAWVYDADRIRAQIARLRSFDVIRFAQKACSNTHILRLMRAEGVLVDAVSLGEIERALTAGYQVHGPDEPVVFTADLLDRATLRRVVELRLPVNAGSPQMLEQLGAASPGTRSGCGSTPASGTGTAARPTPAASRASTASGTNTWVRAWSWSTATAWS